MINASKQRFVKADWVVFEEIWYFIYFIYYFIWYFIYLFIYFIFTFEILFYFIHQEVIFTIVLYVNIVQGIFVRMFYILWILYLLENYIYYKLYY